jgi:hypothetical protein
MCSDRCKTPQLVLYTLVKKGAIRQAIWVKICAWLCFVSCGD